MGGGDTPVYNDNFNLFMINAHFTVKATGVPNFKQARIQIPSKFNFEFLERELHFYHDKEVIDLLKFGFPLAHNGSTGSKLVPKNHGGARDFPDQMKK